MVVHCCGIDTMSGDAVGYMLSMIENHTGTEACARCSQPHAILDWVAVLNPVVSAPEGVTPSAVIGYAMCPTVGQPIFLEAWDMGDDE
jgi:hypothetical protein